MKYGTIEAFKMTKERRADNSDWPYWMHLAWNTKRDTPGSLQPTIINTGDGTLSIVTLEGVHLVSWGDYIVKGVKGEIYPCKPNIFEQIVRGVVTKKLTIKQIINKFFSSNTIKSMNIENASAIINFENTNTINITIFEKSVVNSFWYSVVGAFIVNIISWVLIK